MNSAVISGSETHFPLCLAPKKPINNSIPQSFSTISFSSQLTNSRILFKSPSPGNKLYRASFKAFYAPAESTESLYDLLGIKESGSVSDIKKAYKEMARKYHPDVSPPDRVDEYTRRFILVKQAYETLSDPHRKVLYDQDLASGLGFNFKFSAGRGYEHQQRWEERNGEWKARWQSQLNELKQRRRDSGERMTWGARMRSRR